jgi:CheY-like chemotaxis protein
MEKQRYFNKLENILIVDDSVANIEAVQRTLANYEGVFGHTATSPQGAIEAINDLSRMDETLSRDGVHYGLDAVITDLEMLGDDRSGLDVARYALENKIPVLIATQRESGGNHGPVTTLAPLGLQYGSKADAETWTKILDDTKEFIQEDGRYSILRHAFHQSFNIFPGELLPKFLLKHYEECLNLKGGKNRDESI